MDQRAKDFFEAVSSNDLIRLKKIVSEHSVNVNETNSELNDGTALHMAALNGRDDIIRYLIEECSADVNAKDKSGRAPIHVAVSVYRADIVKYLLSKGSLHAEDAEHVLNEEKVDRFFAGVESGDRELVEKMVEDVGVNCADKGRFNRTALHMAATKGDEAMVRMLVEKYGADVNAMDEIGELPLHNAADNGHMDIVAYLVGKNSSNAEDVAHLLNP